MLALLGWDSSSSRYACPMPLAAGTSLGHYKITAPLGVGGMGKVYRAQDTKLDREVAIKVLPDAVAGDPERLQRFEREAKALAALNHPHVATLYGMEADGDTPFLVMEVVEGPTLAERIAEGRLSFDEALPIFLEIAEALEAAHDQGIVHRDLKPANVKLSPSGVKVLDFGLAKALVPEGPSADPAISHSPTLTLAATARGEILGTAAYMSPEQAQGEAVDQRADIWAFGVCLYEAVTGRRAFDGDNPSKVLAAILMKEVDLAAVEGRVPSGVVRLLEGCLQKDVADRLQSVRDLRLLLAGTAGEPVTSEPVGAGGRGWSRAGLLALVAAAIAAATVWWTTRPEPQPVRRFPLGVSIASQVELGWEPQLSPDESQVTFVARRQDGETILMRRPLDSLVSEPIAGTEGASYHFFSPDGRWLAFFARLSLWKVSLGGGEPIELSPAVLPFGGTWLDDDTILFSDGTAGLWRVHSSGGERELVAREQEGFSFVLPQLLPDREHALVTFFGLGSGRQIGVVPLFQEEPVEARTIAVGLGAVILGDDLLLFRQGGSLLAGRLDPGRWSLEGPMFEVPGLGRGEGRALGGFSVSAAGSLVYVERASDSGARIVRFDMQGDATQVLTESGNKVRVSPQGDRIAYEDGSGIWVSDLARGIPTRLVSDRGRLDNPEWTPDGQRVVFWRVDAGERGLEAISADGAGEAGLLLEDGGRPGNFTPDGRELVFSKDANLWALDLETGEARALLERPFGMRTPVLSPDGRWLAYTSYEKQQPDVFVRPYPEVEAGRWQISDGGHSPAWSPVDGALFYVTPANTMMRADFEATSSGFRAQTPVALFQLPLYGAIDRHYDPLPDGSGFVAAVEDVDESNPPGDVVLVEGFVDDLRRQMAAR